MTDKQRDFIKSILSESSHRPDRRMVEIMVYWEFNSMDYGGKDVDMNSVDLNWLKRSLDASAIDLCGKPIDWGNIQIGKKMNDASLFWLKSFVFVENPYYND